MKKTLYSLPALQEQMAAANQRYHKFLSAIETPEIGVAKLQKLTETVTDHQRRYKGFHLLSEEDASLFRTLLRGEFVIRASPTTRRAHLDGKNCGQITRLLKRLRVHGLVKRVADATNTISLPSAVRSLPWLSSCENRLSSLLSLTTLPA